MLLPGLGEFDFSVLTEIIHWMVDGGSDSEFVQKVSKSFMKDGYEKVVNYVYPVNWINPKIEKQKGNIRINADIFMVALFIQTRETTEETWLYSKDPLNLEQTLLYQGDTFELGSMAKFSTRQQQG